MKILLTGGSGTLGKELIELLKNSEHSVIAPTSSDMDILNYNTCENIIVKYCPDTIVHCAAYTDVKASEKNIEKVINTNIIGTCNMVLTSQKHNIRLVHISTDYVFDGEKGFYKIEDPINPITKYAKSKGAAELAVKIYENSLIIRTSFYGYKFPYDKAFIDQWSSKDYIDIIAPKILSEILSNKTGIVHCVSNRRTIFDIAKERNPNIKPITRKETNFKIPRDTSLI